MRDNACGARRMTKIVPTAPLAPLCNLQLALGVAVLVLGAGCSSGSVSGRDGAPDRDASGGDETTIDGGPYDADVVHGYSLPEFAGGFSFYVRLPPTFSPFLALSGDEATREPPGFYDSTSDFYFSYELIWWLNGTPDLTTSALREDLQDYYVGLCGNANVTVTLDEPASVGAGASPMDAGARAAVLVTRRNGTLVAGTCFGNPVPAATVEVSTYDCPGHPTVLVVVSPQPASSTVWTQLRAVRDGLTCW